MPAMYHESGAPVPGHRASSLRWLAGLLVLALAAVIVAAAVHVLSGRF